MLAAKFRLVSDYFQWQVRAIKQKIFAIRLVRVYFSPQFTSLSWSLDKKRLFAHTTSNKIRIF